MESIQTITHVSGAGAAAMRGYTRETFEFEHLDAPEGRLA